MQGLGTSNSPLEGGSGGGGIGGREDGVEVGGVETKRKGSAGEGGHRVRSLPSKRLCAEMPSL